MAKPKEIRHTMPDLERNTASQYGYPKTPLRSRLTIQATAEEVLRSPRKGRRCQATTELPKAKTKVLDVALKLLEDIDSPKSLAAYICLKNTADHGEYLKLGIDPMHYQDPSRFRDDYLAVSLLSKFPFLNLGIDTKEVAKNAFYAAEKQCKETNSRLIRARSDPRLRSSAVSSVLHTAERKIQKVLGRLPIQRIIAGCGWGPGVSSSVKGSHTSIYNKFLGKPEATSSLITAGAHHLVNAWSPWGSAILQISDDNGLSTPVSVLPAAFSPVRGNAVAFVPKNAKTDRAIAVEPHVNSFLQKGIGSVIRSKLLRIKGVNGESQVDLSSQSINQRRARSGSIDGRLATIDLKAASDTISIEIVRELLPPDWFFLMDVARSQDGLLDGEWFRYHKFSSMGNGFTFELESLIFWAICASVCDVLSIEADVSVYGDDLIVPTDSVALLLESMAFCGFSINKEKSFVTSPFRESCGADFFAGTPVRPFFIKKENNDARDVFRLANAIRRFSFRSCDGVGCDRRFRRTWVHLLLGVPKPFRLRIPDGVGDGGFVGNFDESTPSVAPHGWEGFSFKCLVEKPVSRGFERIIPGIMMMLLTGADAAGYGSYNLRSKTQWREQTMLVRAWTDLGAWI